MPQVRRACVQNEEGIVNRMRKVHDAMLANNATGWAVVVGLVAAACFVVRGWYLDGRYYTKCIMIERATR